MIALIDADIVVYRIGYTTQEDPLDIAEWRFDETIKGILEATNANEYKLFLTGQEKNNFRYEIFPEYKAGRKQEKPTHFYALRSYAIEVHSASVSDFEEADDRMGIEQTENTCIVSIDKDLDQIPGWHYNFVKGIKYFVTPEEGLKFFYTQLLTGDRTDNIMGIRGIGPVKAAKALKDCLTEEDLYNVVSSFYMVEYPDSGLQKLRQTGQLLKIRTREGELWDLPTFGNEPKPEPNSPSTGVVSNI
jgi:5'-3' exonuclease